MTPLLEYCYIILDKRTLENKQNLKHIELEAIHIKTGCTKVCSVQDSYDE